MNLRWRQSQSEPAIPDGLKDECDLRNSIMLGGEVRETHLHHDRHPLQARCRLTAPPEGTPDREDEEHDVRACRKKQVVEGVDMTVGICVRRSESIEPRR
jgi:hypothetical protein